MTYLAQIPCILFKHLLSPGLRPSALLSPALPALDALPDARASLAYSFPTSFPAAPMRRQTATLAIS